MILYTRARRHIDMKRVKEMREEKIKRENIAEILRQQEAVRAELKRIEIKENLKYSNWRRDLENLNEGMTTASIGLIHLPGDPDTIQTSLPSATLSSADNQAPPNENGVTVRRVDGKLTDSSKTDTITITISGSFGSKQVGSNTLNDKVSIGVLVNGTYGGNYLAQELGNGTHTISIPKRFQKANVRFDVMQVHAFEGGGGHQSGTVNITGIGLKRVNPMNVFVGLDDPEASAFIRDTLGGQSLSPEEKKRKLEEQLASSKEYLNKMFGEGMPNTATTIADYEPQQSFADIALDTIPYEEPSPGPGGYKPPGSYDPDKFYDLKTDPSQLPSPNLPATGPGYSSIPDGTKVAASYPKPDPLDKLLKDIDDADKKIKNIQPGSKPGKGRGMGDRWDFTKFVKGKRNTMVAHHEPQGKVIKEKKSFKDITKKIPGYYDGKPSPLGFPLEDPPKMVNGRHPDLVDGKKVANRFKRLDPISARAMPKTGNPHIDKKVRAAAKKPK